MILRILGALLFTLIMQAAEPARTDAQIDAQLRAKLAKSLIGKDGFAFRVKDGVVYWEGATNIPQHKGSATRMAKSAGARRVVNQIRVAGAKKTNKTAPPTPAATPGNKTPPIATPPVANPTPAVSPKRATVHWVPVR